MPTVAYQGEPGAFSELAARRFFGKPLRLRPLPTFERVFASVRNPTYGIVPVENSVFGSIHQVYDLLLSHRLFIVGEVKLRVRLHLVGVRGSALRTIRTIYSQPQAIGQCESFLRTLRRVNVEAYYDTAGAAKMVAGRRDLTCAAIASEEAGRTYGLSVLRRNIESDHKNFTRFIVLARKAARITRGAKTTVVFAVKDIPGALFKSLAVFALRDINLLKIESRPLRGKPWEYLFYLDVDGSPSSGPLRDAVAHLNEICAFVRILGSYPYGQTFTD